MKNLIKKAIGIYRDLSIQAKASVWFLFCNVLQMGLNVITTPVFTRIMSTEEFGMTNTYNSWRSILMIFTSLNLSYGVFNNVMVKYEDSKTRDEYVSCMQGLYCGITIVAFISYWFTRSWCNDVLNMSTELVVLLFMDLLCYPALLFWSGRQRYEFKYKWLVIITLAMSIAYVATGIVAVLVCEQQGLAKIAANVGVNVVFCGAFLLYQFVKGKKLYIGHFWKYALAFNIPLIPHYLSEMVLTQSDRIMISKYDGNTATANYSIAYSIVLIMQLIMSAISASFLPWSYSCLKKEKYKDIRQMSNILMVLVAGCIFVIMMFVPEIIYVFAGPKYNDAIYVIPPIALSIFFMFLYELFSTVEFYHEKNIFVMIASVIAAVLNVVLNHWLIPIYGYYAAGYTTLFCYGAYAIGHFVFYKLVSKKMMKSAQVYDEKFVLAISLILSAVTLVVNIIYDKMILRYVIAILVIAIAIWKRNTIIEQFMKMKAKED